MSETIIRKAEENLDHMSIVKDYADGLLSLPEIAHKYHTSEENIGLIVTRFWKSLTNMKESRALKSSPEKHFQAREVLKELQNTDQINKEFTALLSADDTALLSDHEAIYAWVYVHTGDAIEALQTSKLDVGIYQDKKRPTRLSYDKACILRSHYLNSKPNVQAYIKELRETRLIDMDISKEKIQSELLEQLSQLKASGDPRVRSQILKTIELLGKTIGAFTENIQITEVNPGDALDQLIEMAQEAAVTEIPKSTKRLN